MDSVPPRGTPETKRQQWRKRTKWRRELRALGATRQEAQNNTTGIVRFRAFKAELEGRKR